MASSPAGRPQMPAQARVMEMICGYWMTQALSVTARLGIPDHIAGGTDRLATLATATGSNPGALYRLLRFLGSLGLLVRTEDDRYTLTELGECLRSDSPNTMRNLAILAGAEHYRIWMHLADSVRTGDPSLELALGTPLFEYLEAHPDAGVRFNNAMADLARNVHRAAVAGYDFSTVKTVVDVGGGTGTLLAHLLGTYSHLGGILFDLPHVVDKAVPELTAAGVRDRCEIVGGSFYADRVPDTGDVYTMSLVLHDFNDDDSRRILTAVRRSIPAHATLLVLEQVVPAGNEPHIGKLVDVNMLVISGGRERTEAEFGQLLAETGFRLVQTLPSQSTLNAVVAVPDPAWQEAAA
jgi:O-methyltransferase domain/Dimerisation domain